jgi:hypothetical protein
MYDYFKQNDFKDQIKCEKIYKLYKECLKLEQKEKYKCHLIANKYMLYNCQMYDNIFNNF